MIKAKKLFMFVLMVMLILPAMIIIGTGCTDRSTVLKLYNWGEYIADGTYDSMDIVAEFEDWYYDMTGDEITVECSYFDTNETMNTQIEQKRADYDLICPSDYMIEKMTQNDLLQVINDEEFDEIWEEVFSEEDATYYGYEEDEELTMRKVMNSDLTDLMVGFDAGWGEADGSVYSLPYMYGTLGIMYDSSKVEEIGGEDASEDMKSWEALFGDEYAGHIYMKNSVREAYGISQLYNKTDELYDLSNGYTDFDNDEYRQTLTDAFNSTTDEDIAAAEETLKAQKQNLYAYESDEGKDDLLTGKSNAALGLFWSCDAGYVIGQEENLDLWYEVPEEGTNLWMDNWSIPVYAQNTVAAKYFLAFINTYDVAYENMWWVGSAVPVKAVCDDITLEITDPWLACEYGNEGLAEDDEDYCTVEDYMMFADYYEEVSDDCTEEEGCACEWHDYAQMYAEAICPSEEQLARAAVMTDFGDAHTDIVRMFIRVKAS